MAYTGITVSYNDSFRKLTDEVNKIMQPLMALESGVGDLTLLTTDNQSDIINAINELNTKLGNTETMLGDVQADIGNLPDLTTAFKGSVVGAINSLLESAENRLDDIESSLFYWVASVPTYSAIATTYPSPRIYSTVEVKDTGNCYRFDGTSWNLVPGLVPEDTSSEAIAQLDAKIGDLNDLSTVEKTDLVSAMNEIYTEFTAIKSSMVTTEQQLGVM